VNLTSEQQKTVLAAFLGWMLDALFLSARLPVG
jgi:hypothetical protein